MYETLVKKCNEFLWGHAYPGGDYPLEYRSKQHSDLVKTYFAGIIDGMQTVSPRPAQDLTLKLMPMFCDPNWKPGVEFAPPANYGMKA